MTHGHFAGLRFPFLQNSPSQERLLIDISRGEKNMFQQQEVTVVNTHPPQLHPHPPMQAAQALYLPFIY